MYEASATYIDNTGSPSEADFLAECARIVKIKYRNESYKFVAEKIGIPTTTFHRMYNCEVKRADFNNALSLVKAACPDRNVREFIEEKNCDEFLKRYDETYPANGQLPFADSKLEQFLRNPATSVITVYILEKSGVTRKDVLYEFGRKGISTLNELIEAELVDEVRGKLLISSDINLSTEGMRDLSINLIKNCSSGSKSDSSIKNWESLDMRALNDDGIARIREITSKAALEAREVFNNPNMFGDKIAWAYFVSDTIADLCSEETTRRLNNE